MCSMGSMDWICMDIYTIQDFGWMLTELCEGRWLWLFNFQWPLLAVTGGHLPLLEIFPKIAFSMYRSNFIPSHYWKKMSGCNLSIPKATLSPINTIPHLLRTPTNHPSLFSPSPPGLSICQISRSVEDVDPWGAGWTT